MELKKYFVKKHYPGFCDMCNCPEKHERGYFSTRKEFEGFSWLKPFIEEGYHTEFSIVKENTWEKGNIYVMDVSDDMKRWYVNSVIYGLDDSDIDNLRTWYPEWKYENMKHEDM